MLENVRYWTKPRWKYIEGESPASPRQIRLIVHHPATGGGIASFDRPANTPTEEQASMVALGAWANAFAEEQPGYAWPR